MSTLHTKAVLVTHSRSRMYFRKFDKAISQEIAALKGAPESIGRYHKALLHRRRLTRINSVMTRAYQEHIDRTLPWADGGTRILPTKGYDEYMRVQRELDGELYNAVQEFKNNYARYIDAEELRMGTAFNRGDYPDISTIDDGFKISIDIAPIPDTSDFRVTLNENDEQRIKANLETRLSDALTEAVDEIWNRLQKSVTELRDSTRLHMDGEKRGFFDSWLGGIKAITNVIPKLNITEDPHITEICNRIEFELLAFDGEQLKNTKTAQEKLLDSTDSILDAMAGYM